MKKIFALALAALMTAGMTTVAFAASDIDLYTLEKAEGEFAVFYDKNDDGSIDETEWSKLDKLESGEEEIPGGTKLYIKLLGDGAYLKDKEDVKSVKVKADWKVGETEEKPSIEFVKLGKDYVYALQIVMPENETEKKIDLAGDITVYTSTSEQKTASEATGNLVNLSVSYGYNVEPNFDGDFADPNKGAVVKFDKDADVIDIEFDDAAMFTVDVTGQGKLNLLWNQDFNKEFAAMYDYANIDFITFEGQPTFNKNGTLYIYADEDAFVYEVTADGAKKLDATWDEDYEAWTFKTRTLKSYAISDVELDEKTATEDKDDTTTDGGKENPDTGR